MPTTAIVSIEGVILPERYIWPSDEAVSLYRVRQQLNAYGEFDRIKLEICSPGGYCFEGWKMIDYLLGLGKPIDSLAYGQCASFGTMLAMLGETREITQYCEYMVHRPWDFTWGNDLQMLKFAASLSKETRKMFDYMALRTSQPVEDLEAVIREEDLYLDAQETVNYGFSTAIFKPGALASGRLANDKENFTRRDPKWMLSLNEKEYKVNPDAPTEEFSINNPKNVMAKKKPSNAALQSILDLTQGADTKALDIGLKDGRTLVTNSTGDAPVVGDTATIDGETAPDGEYKTVDDTVITVEGGNITKVEDAAEEEEDTTEQEGESETQASGDLAALRKENLELKAQVKALNEKNEASEKRMTQIETRVKTVLGDLSSRDVNTQANKIPESTKGKQNKSEVPDNEQMGKNVAERMKQKAKDKFVNKK